MTVIQNLHVLKYSFTDTLMLDMVFVSISTFAEYPKSVTIMQYLVVSVIIELGLQKSDFIQ